MKTIYFYGIDNNKGGMETYAFNLIKDVLSKTDEFKFHIISQFEDFSFRNELTNDLKCEFSVVPNRKKHPFKYSKEIYKILKTAKDGDFCQLNIMSYRNIFLLKAVKKSKIKTIVVGHSNNTENKFNYFVHKVGSLFFKNIGLKVANNNSIIEYLCGKKCNNYKIIELGINENLFKFDAKTRNNIRTSLNIENNVYMIGQVGRLCKQKNQVFSCKVMEKIDNPNIQLYFYGKEISNKAIKYSKKHHLTNVHFVGEVNNVNKVYSAFDLFILPSIFESAGLVLYEALSNGCSSIISNFVPTDGIESKHLYVEKLNIEKWKELILKQYENYLGRDNIINVIPSHESQISKYIDLYKLI